MADSAAGAPIPSPSPDPAARTARRPTRHGGCAAGAGAGGAWWVALGALAAVATGLRIWTALRYAGVPPRYNDSWTHLDLARQWRAGEGLSSSAEISAGYPLYLATVDLVRSVTRAPLGLIEAVGVAQAWAGGGTVVLAGVLGRRVAGAGVGLAGAALLALWPNLVLGSALPLAETVTAAAVLVVVLLLSATPRPRRGELLAAGVALGVAVELRPSCLVLLALFATVPTGAPVRARAASVAVATFAALLVIAPFAARSSVVAGTFVPFDLRAGVNLCLGRAPGADRPPIDRAECPVPVGASAREADRIRSRQAWEAFRADPWREPRLVAVRARVTVWDPDRSSIDEIGRQDGRHLGPTATDRTAAASTALSRAVLVLALVGTVVAAFGRRAPLLRVAAAGWLLLVPSLVALGDVRYRIPSLPFLAIVAASAAAAGLGLLTRRRTPFSIGGVDR